MQDQQLTGHLRLGFGDDGSESGQAWLALPEAARTALWDEISVVHYVETLYPWEGRALVQACYTALRPEGMLYIEAPDLAYCCAVLVGRIVVPKDAWAGEFDMWGIYGDPGAMEPARMRKWGYTPASLASLCRDVGFRKIRQLPGRAAYGTRDFSVEATK